MGVRLIAVLIKTSQYLATQDRGAQDIRRCLLKDADGITGLLAKCMCEEL